ncbi:MAG: type II secretion system protein GspM [Thiomonas sp.]|uniref:type II secretion system protein GspM n=1 Tax=Thiomonas sp. TaxID=2047785 RepID=UPI002A361677|nr:type II secretion system protein GspM [Thiomonas sp.]MDY0330410.1 type II secretion system protein GspM [Thiomonas sp.]
MSATQGSRVAALSALWYRGLPQAVALGRQRWAAMSPRERFAVGSAAVLVLAALLWLLAIKPAWRTLQTAPQRIVSLQQQLQTLQQDAQRIAALRSAPSAPAFSGDLQAAIVAWFKRVDPGAKVQAQVLPGEVTLSITALRPATLPALAQAARRDWSAQVDGADLERGQDGALSGTVHLSRQGSGGG